MSIIIEMANNNPTQFNYKFTFKKDKLNPNLKTSQDAGLIGAASLKLTSIICFKLSRGAKFSKCKFKMVTDKKKSRTQTLP